MKRGPVDRLDSPFPREPAPTIRSPPRISPELQALLEALPRCCNCGGVGVITNRDRWVLCARCWENVPCGDEKPVYDLRPALKGLIDA